MHQSIPISQELLSHQAFLKRLASDLVGEDADDLVQEVWQRVLERPPQHGRQLRGWLIRIARNLAADRWRGDARRRSREEQRASEPSVEEDLEARLELRTELVEALGSLGPTHREAILLRYFEDLAPRQIAKRQGIPVATVKKRLQRGLEQLREALDQRHEGDRDTWLCSVSALAVPLDRGVETTVLVMRAMAMGTMMKVSAAALVAVTFAYFVIRAPVAEPPRAPTVDPLGAEPEPTKLLVDELGAAVDGLDRATGRRVQVVGSEPGKGAQKEDERTLQVLLEGVEDDSAGRATVTILGVRASSGRTESIRETFPIQGRTTDHSLNPFLARLKAQSHDWRQDELAVRVDHPLHFSESHQVSLSNGVLQEDGGTIYTVQVRLAEVIYWPELRLSVRDATTGAHLEGVELRCAPTAYMGLLQQPGASEPFTPIGTGLNSPIGMRGGRKASEPEAWAAGLALEPRAGEARLPAELAQPEETGRGIMMYARAPGYAWGHLVLDISQGRERELLLEPAAAINMRLANVQVEQYAAIGKQATLFLRKIGSDGEETTVWSKNLDESYKDRAMRIDALEPGEYAALVELSESWRRKPIELVRETTTLSVGKEGELLLALPDPPPAPVLTALGGVVAFPKFGGEEHVRLELYGSDYRYGDPDFELSLADLEPVGASLPTWSFRVEELPVGRYQARLMPFLNSWMIDVPEGGRDDAEFMLSKLAEVFVESVDAGTEQRLALQAIAFRTLEVLPNQLTHGGSRPWLPIEYEDEPGRFRFWTAPGAVAIRTWGDTGGVLYGRHPKEFELMPGHQSIRLPLTPSCLIRFEFRVDGAALPHEDSIFVGLSQCIRAVGHDGHVGGVYPYSLVEASIPGTYEINFDGVGTDRFLPIPTRRVEVHAGETTGVVVELRRK